MTKSFADMIGQATALTRTGQLNQATALIQAALTARDGVQETVLEGKFTRVDPADRVPRTRLGETLRKISAGGMPGARVSRSEPALPEGAEFLSLSHDGPLGKRSYRLYVPANRQAQMPLIVMLHGCTQTPEDFATGTGMNLLAEEFGCLVAYPCQPSAANAQKCWNWFRPEDQASGAGEPALIAGITRAILRDFNADPQRVFIAGLSAGGAAALIVGAAYPDIFAAVGVHSGLAIGAARDVPSAFAAMRTGARGIPLGNSPAAIVFHGLADTTVNAGNAKAIISQITNSAIRPTIDQRQTHGKRTARITRYGDRVELWEVEGAGHAWSGGSALGSYTDPTGPDASRQMMRFFLNTSK